ncbi:MAG TPA: DUF6544 family protein [Thermoleophilia bacterium]|nr:DUF6544 family protein [Thermoleophilia bacterium]
MEALTAEIEQVREGLKERSWTRWGLLASAVLAGVVALGWVGLRVPPGSPAAPAAGSADLGTVAVPQDLPAPVLRFVAAVSGGSTAADAPPPQTTPLYETAIQQGHGTMKLGGLSLPFRVNIAGRIGEERHSDMELTWFGLGVVSGVDDYIANRGRTQMAGRDLAEAGDYLNQGAYLAVKAEQIGFPGSWILDPRVRWESGADDQHARLVLIRERLDGTTAEEYIDAAFDPATGFLKTLDTMRHKSATSGKRPWHVELADWRNFAAEGRPPLFAAGRIEVTWMDQGEPWLKQTAERIVTNVPVNDQLVW